MIALRLVGALLLNAYLMVAALWLFALPWVISRSLPAVPWMVGAGLLSLPAVFLLLRQQKTRPADRSDGLML